MRNKALRSSFGLKGFQYHVKEASDIFIIWFILFICVYVDIWWNGWIVWL